MRLHSLSISVTLCLLLAGCVTTGGGQDQVTNTIYQTHRIVSRMDQGISGSVDQLNITAADLSERVNQSNQDTRRLQSMVEENQMKLAQVESKLDGLTRTLYQYLGLTTAPPAGGAPSLPEVRTGEPEIATAGPTTTTSGFVDEPPMLIDDPPVETIAPATAAGPSDPVSDYNRAIENYRTGNYDVALEQFGAILTRYPNSENADNAQFWKAECCFKLDRFQEAVTEFETLRQRFPDSQKVPYAMFNQAAAHLRLGQQSRALELLRDLVENYPMTPAAARARTKLKEVEGA